MTTLAVCGEIEVSTEVLHENRHIDDRKRVDERPDPGYQFLPDCPCDAGAGMGGRGMISVGDDDGAIRDALAHLLARVDAVIATGASAPRPTTSRRRPWPRRSAWGCTATPPSSRISGAVLRNSACRGRRTTPNRPFSRRGGDHPQPEWDGGRLCACVGRGGSSRSSRAFPPRPGGCFPRG